MRWAQCDLVRELPYCGALSIGGLVASYSYMRDYLIR